MVAALLTVDPDGITWRRSRAAQDTKDQGTPE